MSRLGSRNFKVSSRLQHKNSRLVLGLEAISHLGRLGPRSKSGVCVPALSKKKTVLDK